MIARDIRAHHQTKAKAPPVLGGSLVWMGWPELDQVGQVHNSRELKQSWQRRGWREQNSCWCSQSFDAWRSHGSWLSKNARVHNTSKFNVKEVELDSIRYQKVKHKFRGSSPLPPEIQSRVQEILSDRREPTSDEFLPYQYQGQTAINDRPPFCTSPCATRGGAPFDDEHDEKHHKLAARQISIQAVALECKCCILVSVGAAIFVKVGVNWGKTDQRCLLSFNRRKPDPDNCEDCNKRQPTDLHLWLNECFQWK